MAPRRINVAEAHRLLANGASRSSVARRFGTSRAAVTGLLRRYPAPAPQPGDVPTVPAEDLAPIWATFARILPPDVVATLRASAVLEPRPGVIRLWVPADFPLSELQELRRLQASLTRPLGRPLAVLPRGWTPPDCSPTRVRHDGTVRASWCPHDPPHS
jgi:hypothetical protein